MKIYRYDYQSIIRFDLPISQHYFKLRCIPVEQPFQHLKNSSLQIFPEVKMLHDVDAFGNPVQYGHTLQMHDAFVFTSSGQVEQTPYLIKDKVIAPYYRLESHLTYASVEMRNMATKLSGLAGDVRRRATAIADAVFNHMTYCPGSTNNHTTAAEAFAKGCGVCQDYTHIFISLCRLLNIPSRYVNGFMHGVGATHAWAEVFDGEQWIGIDPTNNNQIEYGYIKIANGRDASDCPVNRGIFFGSASQTSEIRVLAEEITF